MTRKSFKNTNRETINNPALSFISETALKGEEATETKSKRLNLLIKPSVAKDIDKIATMQRVSTNELINILLSKYRDDNKELIEKYDNAFGGNENE